MHKIRFIAAFFLLIFFFIKIGNTQNTGPNNIDHANYKPIATNMVNHLTGDFSYSLPIVAVPSPESEYPFSLVYHAGITTDQDASWVGLGWLLSAGAINRTVNGFPDDWNGKRVQHIMTQTSQGNHTQHVDLHGYGKYNYISTGLQSLLGHNRALFGYIKRTFSVSEYGNKKAYGTLYLENAYDGYTVTSNSDYGKIQAEGAVMDVYSDILSPLEWNDETGYPEDNVTNNVYTQPNYDEYSVSGSGIYGLMTPRIFECGDLVGESKTINGTLSEDQGIYSYTSDKELACHFDNSSDKITKSGTEIAFYFDKVHNSYLEIENGDFGTSGNPVTGYDYTGGGILDEIPDTCSPYYNDSINYNSTTKRKGCARYVEWFTNDELESPTANVYNRGFIETSSLATSRINLDGSGIGAFVITDAGGTTYHYSLPVYQYEQFYKDEVETDFYERRQVDPYAYTWLLTAVTGPDYVDANNNHQLDEEDYGSWFEFSYGKWTDGYVWRTPYTGYMTVSSELYGDPEYPGSDHKKYYWGRKEIYYLNSARSRTHTAYFVKSIRDDAMGKNITENTTFSGKISHCSKIEEDGWNGITASTNENDRYVYSEEYTNIISSTGTGHTKVLKLEKIILVANEDANLDMTVSSNIASGSYQIILQEKLKNLERIDGAGSFPNTIERSSPHEVIINDIYYEENVLDIGDLVDTGGNGTYDIEESAINVIEFDYSYTLGESANVPNSVSGKGKLTLGELQVYGEEKTEKIPSYKFIYFNSNYDFLNNQPDVWGFDNTNPKNWSLKTILTPMGGKIHVDYEEDTYNLLAYMDNPDGEYIDNNRSGGGIRVKSLMVDDGDKQYKKSYSYNYETEYPYGQHPPIFISEEIDDLTSGITSYIPFISLSSNFRPIPYFFDIPKAEVLYEYVRARTYDADATDIFNDDTEYESETVYLFEVPDVTGNSEDALFGFGVPMSYNYDDSVFIVDNDFLITSQILDLGGDEVVSENTQGTSSFTGHFGGNVYKRNTTIHDNSAAIGRPVAIINRNKFGHDVNQQWFNYWAMDSLSTGIIQETFTYRKRYSNSGVNQWFLNSSSKRVYPSVLRGIMAIADAVPSSIEYTKFDFYTGIPIEIKSGKSWVERTPAYKICYDNGGTTVYPYKTMGAKSDDSNKYRNLLNTFASTYAYNKDSLVVSTSINVYDTVWNYRERTSSGEILYQDVSHDDIYRFQKSFLWKGKIKNSGAYKEFNEHNYNKFFDWSLADLDNNVDSGWQKIEEVTRYDHFSTPVEVKDINENKSSTKSDPSCESTIASGGYANYNSFTATGFENYYEINQAYTDYGGEVIGYSNYSTTMCSENVNDPNCPSASGINAHSGDYYVSIQLGSGPKFRRIIGNSDGLMTGKYRASIWVHEDSPTSNSGLRVVFEDGTQEEVLLDNSDIQVGEWKQLNLDFEVGSTYIGQYINVYYFNESVTCALIDDFRIQPVDAQVVQKNYDKKTGYLTSFLDNNNFATFYEYDKQGQVKSVSIETIDYGIKKVKEYDYHYARED